MYAQRLDSGVLPEPMGSRCAQCMGSSVLPKPIGPLGVGPTFGLRCYFQAHECRDLHSTEAHDDELGSKKVFKVSLEPNSKLKRGWIN